MLSTEENFRLLSYSELTAAYMAEIQVLAAIVRLPEFPGILEKLRDYPKFLRSRAQGPSALVTLLNETRQTRVVEAARLSPAMRESLALAHLAASCVLLAGSRFDLAKFQAGVFVQQAEQMLSGIETAGAAQIQSIMRRLMGMDAVRTIQLLRGLGLITRKPDKLYQLGLGASTGEKDIQYVHNEPQLTIEAGPGASILTLGARQQRAADVIINDLGPRYTEQYQQLAADPQWPATGYVCDTFELLETLSHSAIRKRNLVTMLRIEPAMIPDAREFLHRLHPVLDETCDFVLTIGLGDSAEAYRQRIEVVASLFAALDSAGLKPVLFRLHLGGDVERQAATLQFGSPRSASFEILYCRLERKALRKTFA